MESLTPKKWLSVGGPVPLFDRLIDDDPETPEEAVPLTTYNQEKLIESVIREATSLLNTRCKIPLHQYQEEEPSTLTYGVPDLYGLLGAADQDPARAESQTMLCRFMENALRLFDSRLSDIRVQLDSYNASNQTINVTIHATLLIGSVREAISFPVIL